MLPYNDSLKSLKTELQTDFEKGLSSAEAAKRLETHGHNQLTAKPAKTLFARFMDQMKDPMIIVLLAAAAINVIATVIEGTFKEEFFEPLLILAIVVANAVMGVTQESKAEKALEALKEMSAPHARVLRDGAEVVLDSKDLVPGDVILIEAGDFIPADGRLITSASLKSEESALTGESLPSEKEYDAEVAANAGIGDRNNMVFSGCSVAYGRAKYLVTSTAMDTEMGRIAGMLNEEEDGPTPLQLKLADLSKKLGILALGACLIVFLVGAFLFQKPIIEIFMVAVSLAVSAIPEGLPAIVTIVLSIGVQRMVKQNAIIRNLPAVETLGSASVICSDKTGTLTQNRMTLVKAYSETDGEIADIQIENSKSVTQLLRLGTLCCDGSVIADGNTIKHLGDPTETCIVLAAQNSGMPKENLNKQYPRISEVPFDSDRKLMSVICEIDGKKVVVTKGAFDSLATRCVKGDLEKARRLNDEMSSNALRVLALAYKEIDEIPAKPNSDNIENNLVFLGLVGMIDPPRPEVRDAVAVCRAAGIATVMITGDHVVTASAIAKDLGIQEEDDVAITGAQLQQMSEEELDSRVEDISVYARVSPEDKIRIVKAWQRRDDVVAMTGDGVNDAPALKAADIGCAMGITGTDVAKGAADMTLTDDNFTTIVHAVKEGRGIYENIRKAVAFLLSSNIGEVLTVFIAMMIWHESPLVSMQLLWINLVTDGLPAIALGRETVEDSVMNRKPRSKNEGIFADGLGLQVIVQGVLFAVLTLLGFYLGYHWTGLETGKLTFDFTHYLASELDPSRLDAGRTMAFWVLAMIQLFHSYNMRSKKSIFKIGVFTNKHLNQAFLICFAMMCVVMFVPPIASAFALTAIHPALYFIGLAIALVPLPALELFKAITNAKEKKA